MISSASALQAFSCPLLRLPLFMAAGIVAFHHGRRRRRLHVRRPISHRLAPPALRHVRGFRARSFTAPARARTPPMPHGHSAFMPPPASLPSTCWSSALLKGEAGQPGERASRLHLLLQTTPDSIAPRPRRAALIPIRIQVFCNLTQLPRVTEVTRWWSRA
jgi:hypothetical protein